MSPGRQTFMPLDRRRWTTENRGVRTWVLIAIVCIGGTAAAREPRRKTGVKSASGHQPAVAPAEPPEPKPKGEPHDYDDGTGVCDCRTCGLPHLKRDGRQFKLPAVPAGEVPTTALTGTEVVDGFRAVEPAVQECRAANARPDPISVHAAIAKDGKISAVTLKDRLAPATASCIENAVKAAHFRASSGLAADYVFLYRRFESAGGQAPRDGGADGAADTAGQ